MKILFLFFLSLSSLFGAKESIIKEINSISIKDVELIYLNVLDRLEEERNTNSYKFLTSKENIRKILLNYKDMLEAIAYNESNFKYLIGFVNKNDVSYFQINIGSSFWNVEKLSLLTKENVSRDKLLEDVNFSAKVALHVLIYNIGIHANYYKYNPDMLNMIASYHNPLKINEVYKNSAKHYLRSENGISNL